MGIRRETLRDVTEQQWRRAWDLLGVGDFDLSPEADRAWVSIRKLLVDLDDSNDQMALAEYVRCFALNELPLLDLALMETKEEE